MTPMVISKNHSAGVTSAKWHPTDSNIFASGSYDEVVFIWDKRNMNAPLISIPTGGGVWRIKWYLFKTVNKDFELLLTANMQGGCKLYQFFVDEKEIEYDEFSTVVVKDHQIYENIKLDVSLSDQSNVNTQLAYGVSLLSCEEKDEDKSLILNIASCSFYDNLLQLWKIKVPL